MAIKNYIVKNKKKNLCIFMALILCITSLFVWQYVRRTNASVFVKDENGNKVLRDKIKVLEVVAREGQQVLGYTVEGQEPISVSDIQNYRGSMNLDVEDFENATGYKVDKTYHSDGTYTYTVLDNVLNHTFNDNVLGQQMAVGEIEVDVIQADKLRTSDIKNVDLVYINSNNYNSNLLYYYDQFKNNGAWGIEEGDTGYSYNGVYSKNVDKYLESVLNIIDAAGSVDRAEDLSADDFEYIKNYHMNDDSFNHLPNYLSYNFNAYVTALAELDDEYFEEKIGNIADINSTETAKPAVQYIDEILTDVNTAEREAAVEFIRDCSIKAEITGEDEVKLYSAFQVIQLTGYNSINNSAYIDELRAYSNSWKIPEAELLGGSGVPSFIDDVNAKQARLALEDLVVYKATIAAAQEETTTEETTTEETTTEETTTEETTTEETTTEETTTEETTTEETTTEEPVDEYGLRTIDYQNILVDFQKANGAEIVYPDYASEYVEKFIASDGFTDAADYTTNSASVDTIIKSINDKYKAEVLTRFADLPGDTAKITEFAATAAEDFELMGLTDYNKYYVDFYINKLFEVTDANAFKTSGVYDFDKIDAFISGISSSDYDIKATIMSDLSWKSAKALLEAAYNEKIALIYSTDMMTTGVDKNKIGNYASDYTDDEIQTAEEIKLKGVREVDNTNNMYKMILLLRQIRDTYYYDNLQDKIDEQGNYWPAGIGNGEAIVSWYRYTFATGAGEDFTTYTKYHEPEVVGQTYGTDGTLGNSENYVFKRVYCYSGGEFFGGKRFVNGVADDLSSLHYVFGNPSYTDKMADKILTTSSKLEQDNYMLVDMKNASNSLFRTNEVSYAHIWDENDVVAGTGTHLGYKVTREVYTGYWRYWRVEAPEGFNNFLFNVNNYWSGSSNQTNDYHSSTNNTGKLFSVNGKDIVQDTTSTYAIAGITNSIAGDTVEFVGGMDARFWLYSSVPSGVKASYKLYVDNNLIYSGNADGAHYNDGTGSQPFTLSDQIKISEDRVVVGDDVIELYRNESGNTQGSKMTIGYNSVLKIRLDYSIPGWGAVARTYSYKNAKQSYSMEVSNFNNGGSVDFCGYADIGINYKNIDNVQYSYKGGGYQAAPSGTVLNLGNELAVGESATLSIRYLPKGTTTTKTITTTLKKNDTALEKNYLSRFAASNTTELARDNTLPTADNEQLTRASKGEVIRYLLRISLSEVIYPYNVLEIQPAAKATDYNSFTGALTLAQYLNVDAVADGMTPSNYQEYFNVTSMSVKEFNTRNEDLTATYDLIYFGLDSGYMLANSYMVSGKTIYRTKYNDTSMNGLVYTGIGDLYPIQSFLKGVAASDYKIMTGGGISQAAVYRIWKTYFTDGFTGNDDPSWNLDIASTGSGGAGSYYVLKTDSVTTRLNGNDITVKRKDDLMNYLKAGFPILLPDAILNCDSSNYIDYNSAPSSANAARWRYVDRYSKMYAFITEAKALGKVGTEYTDATAFDDGKTYASLVSVEHAADGGNPEYLPADQKFQGGLSYAYRRVSKVEFEFASGPQQYGYDTSGNKLTASDSGQLGTIIKTTDSDYSNYTIVLNVKRQGGVDIEELDGKYDFKMYVDKSGVGKFEDDSTIQIDCSHEYVTNDAGKVSQVVIKGNWPGTMEGFIPWKIVVGNRDNEELKFSYVGFSAFETSGSAAKDVYVLWVYPANNNSMTLNFREVLNANDQYYLKRCKEAGYNIHLLCSSYAEFNSIWDGMTDDYTNDRNKEFTKETSRLKPRLIYDAGKTSMTLNYNNLGVSDNQELDMIVVGFSDSHAEMDFKTIPGLKNIEYFLQAGHSLLYSHDNSSFWSSLNWYKNLSSNVVSGNNQWGRYNTSFFRQMLGMDQYGVMCGGPVSELPEVYANARKYLNPSLIKQENFRAITENCTFHYTSDSTYTAAYSNTWHGSTKNGFNDWSHTDMIMRTNEGQITNYPFIMNERMYVGTTHAQYNTISLEDPDLTVWYVLDEIQSGEPKNSNVKNPQLYKFTKGDGSNNYYIYSKGNITYTGSGHHASITLQEQQLFINTVIASLKTGNYPPVITLKNAVTVSGQQYYDYYTSTASKVGVTFNPLDYDRVDGDEDTFTNCLIYVDVDGNGEYEKGKDILLNDPSNLFISGEDGNSMTVGKVLGVNPTTGVTEEQFNPKELPNRVDKTFYFTEANLNAINTRLKSLTGNPDAELMEVTNAAGIVENVGYNIIVEVYDRGYLKALNPEKALKEMANTSFKIRKKTAPTTDYFNLN